MAQKPVEVSSGESHGESEEEADSEKTLEEVGETSPLSKAEILRALPDDAEVDARQEVREQLLVPTKGRSSLVARGAASTPTSPGAGSGSASAPPAAARTRALAPQVPMLSGFKLPKRKVEYLAVDWPTSSAKKRKEDTAAVPPSAEKGGSGTCISPARSSSRGQEEHCRVETAPMAPLAPEVPALGAADQVRAAPESTISQALVTMSLPPTAAAPLPGSPVPATVLERALSEMTQLQADLLSTDPRLVVGRLELASGWLHSDLAVRAALGQAAAASEKEKRGAASAAADREAALKDAKAAHDRCQELESELQSLHDKHAEEACLDELLEPVAEDQYEAAAAAVQDQVGALLRKFRGFVFAPLSGDVVDLAAGGEGEDKIAHGEAPSAGDGDV
nr:uncharacterized protein LOC109756511 [Aegilops tauschii subsp. strangulata]